MVYVSVTGLRVKSFWRIPFFFWRAIPAIWQARRAPGNISAQVRTIDGVQHTLSIWRSREDMRAYNTSGAHLQAMKDFRKIATGATCGYEADAPPSWDEAIAYWRSNAKPY
jgi:hypothetical protein